MFDSLVPPLVCGIIFFTVYRIIELFARRGERISIIEKLSENLDPSIMEKQIKSMNYFNKISFSSLKTGCLCIGLGLGLLIGYFIT
ncbi:MAG: hypothetical protein LIP01_12685, partial [Tannerellaceae bacterium]|nr:hypothetical protein [Tannerellaceae bacterium]